MSEIGQQLEADRAHNLGLLTALAVLTMFWVTVIAKLAALL